jgi:hypothetical protein
MDNQPLDPNLSEPVESAWAAPVSRLTVSEVPNGATNLNVEGRQPVSPLQGFGQMWQKTFKIRLEGIDLTPEAVMDIWKANFQKFQPPENRFYPTLSGIRPGEVLLIEARVPPLPGLPSLLPVATGVMVLYVDATTFTVMTPEGHPESGWNTFNVHEEGGCMIAQAQSLCRPSDPLYDIFNRFLGSSSQQDKIWSHVLQSLAGHLGVKEQPVEKTKVLVDPKVQWSQAKNIWKNAGIRTVFYLLGAPLRGLHSALSGSKRQ